MLSRQQAKYFAYELTKIDKENQIAGLSQALLNAQVDLNPHQIDAASFAMYSPLSKGSILADEVGLGKTIEAGIVLCQYWAERKRHLLVVCPASLREQWKIELEEKFNLQCIILNRQNYYPSMLKLDDKIIILSYNYAARISEDIAKIDWNLCVFDEAHKLRNGYRESNKTGQALIAATRGKRKLLLTATPLQNSLMELYGLSYFIDDQIFGDEKSFRAQYSATKSSLNSLKTRLSNFCKRTLRSQVMEYIKYTERKPITFPFEPSNSELELSLSISRFLQKENLYALPPKHKHLISLILYKLLSSSSSAILGTLETMKNRLLKIKDGTNTETEDNELSNTIQEANIDNDFDDLDSTEDFAEEIDLDELNNEIKEIDNFISLAQSINVDKKTEELLKALETGFSEMRKSNAQEKALIFTESRRTQKYLYEYLTAHGYKDQIVLFYGGNRLHRDDLLKQFKNEAKIMIATEAGAEGLNMQFCSLLINYDLPWNPQRVEQRIGRCHRYGQKHDVVVINFVNIKNPADQRVFEILNDKFHLFEGVFGASDEILGSIEDGVDFENKILKIYQTCRSEDEIKKAFDTLQNEMGDVIQEKMKETKKKLLSEFDATVAQRLNVTLENTKHLLTEKEDLFWRLAKEILHNDGIFNDEELSFTLTNKSLGKLQKYFFITHKRREEADSNTLLRLNHPIGQYIIETAKKEKIDTIDEITFDVTNDPLKHTFLQEMQKDHLYGYCRVDLLTINSFETEEYIVLSGIDNYKKMIDADAFKEMLKLNVLSIKRENTTVTENDKDLDTIQHHNIENTKLKSQNRNNDFFESESAKIDKYAEDKLYIVEKELRDVKEKIKSLTREGRSADTIERKTIIQQEISDLEKKKRRLRQNIFDAEDEIEQERNELIAALEAQMNAKINQEHLFTFKWKLQ